MKTNVERPTSNFELRSSEKRFVFTSTFGVRRSAFDVRLSLILLLLGVLPLLTGCQPATPTASEQKTAVSAAPLPPGRQPTADEAVASDPCSTRLHDIEGALLMYYALNKQFPASLEDLKPFADAGTELKLTCPVSNLPYVYSSAGLVAAGSNMKIIVWDPTPAHNGMRWCIVMPFAAPGAALVPDVKPIGEKEFAAFVPTIQ